jgi:hypothetical protein
MHLTITKGYTILSGLQEVLSHLFDCFVGNEKTSDLQRMWNRHRPLSSKSEIYIPPE